MVMVILNLKVSNLYVKFLEFIDLGDMKYHKLKRIEYG